MLIKLLPEVLLTDMSYLQQLIAILKVNELKYLSISSIGNAARLLIHFYNKSRSDYPELRRLTELSQGGLSKFMTSLRRRNLIETIGWQKHAPTARALHFMRETLPKKINVLIHAKLVIGI